MTKVVVLDVDGTLMDTNYPHVEAWARAFEEVGQRVPRAQLHRQVGKGSEKLIHEFVEDEETIAEVNELHGEIYMDLQRHAYPLPGARDLIASLAERRYEVWLVTNAKPEELEQYLDQLETKGKIAGIIKAAEVEEPKPAPDVFELALERSGGEADEIVAVGDTVWDVKAAAEAGIRTVAVLSGGAFSEEELKEAGAVAVYDNCAELLNSRFPENH